MSIVASGSRLRQAGTGLKLAAAVLLVLSVVVGAGVAMASGSAHATTSTTTFNVMAYGANPNGSADNTAAFAAAIAAAEKAGGGIVYVPAGTYAFTQVLNGSPPASIKINGVDAVTLEGAGASSTALVEHVAGQDLVSVKTSGSIVEGLTLNALSYGGGSAVLVIANDTQITEDSILGAQKMSVNGSGIISPLAVNFAGPNGASQQNLIYNTDNQLTNDYIEDGVNNDGIAFAFQQDGTISNITHFGTRLALYIDQNVTVTNDTYTPNPVCGGAQQGFYITGPSSGITISNFTSSGPGGVLDGSVDKNALSNITIENEQLTSTTGGFHLEIGNVNGLTIEGSNFGTNNSLLVSPAQTAGVTVENSTVPNVQFSGYNKRHYSSVSLDFKDDTFPAYDTNGKPAATFLEKNTVGKGTVTVDGGTWSNQSGGFFQAASTGATTTFVISNLPPINVVAPSIQGTPTVGSTLTAVPGTWWGTPTATYTYQWLRNGNPISGATLAAYTPVSADAGHNLKVTVTASNGISPNPSATSSAVVVQSS